MLLLGQAQAAVQDISRADQQLVDAICTSAQNSQSVLQQLTSLTTESQEALDSLQKISAPVSQLLASLPSPQQGLQAASSAVTQHQAPAGYLQATSSCADDALAILENALVGNAFLSGRGNQLDPPAADIAKLAADPLQQHQAQAAELQEIVESVVRLSGLQISYRRAASRPAVLTDPRKPQRTEASVAAAEASVLVLECPGAWVALVALAGPGRPEALQVSFHGWADLKAAGSGHTPDAWTNSNVTVFRRLTTMALRAMAFFIHRARILVGTGALGSGQPSSSGAIALMDLLLWLTTYRDVFSRRCAATGSLLAPEPASQHMLPPLIRPFRCSRAQLLQRARTGSPAFHVHTAPPDAL
ncbi:hypothetical protein WJX73_010399 [Symbiochloris irregularis]|uniref:Uncharacterized protein n=1 Tax=Symbiochloris irregularis TaxID=706552 RepID=A0AAW1NUB0_9CHLO